MTTERVAELASALARAGTMDGREIAEQLARVAHSDEQSFAELSLWAGIAIARLLEYQRRLESADQHLT